MVCIFKVGDIVHAKEYGIYVITDRGKPCKIMDIEGDKIKLQCLWNCDIFWESYIIFEKMHYNDILHREDTVIFVKDFYLECTTIPKGAKVKFLEYYNYGVSVLYKDKIIRVSIEYIKKWHKGMLI